ncbi:MAG: aminoglycoside phosphotransferase family protein, partial [Armatimonadetes bacterium]|nr:aminoglycoside phosphotransferase family protein [Armatimonadota bacterium]
DEGPCADTADQWRELFGEIRSHLYPHMRHDAREEVFRLFTGFLDDPRLHSFIPALRHGDFGAGNILFDASNRAITGIIDFSGAAIGDPAVDFAALLCYGDDFTLQVAEVYPEAEPLLQRAHFYVGTFALQEALHGLRHGDAEAFQSGMASYAEQSE